MARHPVPDRERLERLAAVFAALADPQRLRLLRLLAGGERHVRDVAAAAALTPSKTSHHLSTLAAAGLAARRRDGHRVYYAAAPGVRVAADGGLYVPAHGLRVSVRRRA